MRKGLVPALFWHFYGIFVCRTAPDLLLTLPSSDSQDSLCNSRLGEGEISTLEKAKAACSWEHYSAGTAPRARVGSGSEILSRRCFKASVTKVSKTHEGIKTASPRYFVPFLIAELPILFKNGSKFFIILVFIGKTWGPVVIPRIFAIQETNHKYLCF